MTSIPDNPAPETLLAQQDFVRGLVQSLLRGADGVEDVVQGTLMRALVSPPRDANRARQWLASVARNLARDHQRGVGRRRSHERRASQTEALPSTAEVVQREHERKRVVEAVLRLSDPYRTAVLLRYWEDISSKDLARRMQIPESTARSHVHRGLGMLRKQLDQEYGGRNRWMVALTPCAAISHAAPPAAGALLMSSKPKILFAACGVLLAGLAIFATLEFGDGDNPPEDPQRSPGTLQATLPAQTDKPAAAPTRVEVSDSSRQAVTTAAGEMTVLGVVTDKGEPFRDFELSLQWFAGHESKGKPTREYRVRTDAHGAFTWRGPKLEVASILRASIDNPRVKLLDASVLVTPEDDVARLDLTGIPLDCVLFGVIKDTSGKGIPNGRISIHRWAGVTADEQGRYSLNVGRGDHSRALTIWAPDHTPRTESTTISVTASRYELDFVLQPGGRIAGRVVNEAGEPVTAARVATSLPYYHVTTDEDGKFELTSLGAASDHHVVVKAAGYLNAGKTFALGTKDAELVVKRGLEFRGRILDEDDRAVAGATVEAAWERHGSRQNYTRADGTFHLTACGNGRTFMKVSKAGFVTKRVTATVSEDTEPLTVRIERGHSVRGRVSDLAGSPIAGASVYVSVGKMQILMDETRGITDAQGRFELRDLSKSATYNLSAIKYGFRKGLAENVTTDASDVHIRLERGASLAGRVLDAITRQPISTFSFCLSLNKDFSGRGAATNVNDTDGYWESRWKSYTPGQVVHALIEAEGYAPHRVAIEAMIDPQRDQSVVLMSKAATLVGTIRDANTGKPIPKATIKLMDAADDQYWRIAFPSVPSSTSDASGRFTMKSVGEGSIKLVIIHPDYTDKIHGPIAIGAGAGEVRVPIVLDHGVVVSGRIEGFDARNLKVQIMSSGGLDNNQTKKLGAAREFRFEGLGKGRHVIAIHGAGQSFLRYKSVVIADADIDDVVLRESEGPCTVTVKIRGLDAGEARIRGAKGTATASRMFEFQHGEFTQSGLAAGSYDIRIEHGQRRVNKTVQLEAGRNTEIIEFEK